MKRLIGAIIITLLLAGLCFGVLFTAKSKSKTLLAEYLRGIDNWSVENAYYNPFTHSFKIKGFTVAWGVVEFSIKNMLLSDFKQIEDMITCSVSLEKILFIARPDPSEDIEITEGIKIAVDSFSASVRLDKEKLDKFIETPSTEFNPLKSFDDLELNRGAFSAGEKKFISLENLTGDGYSIGTMFRLAAGEDNKSMEIRFAGFPFYPVDSVSIFSNLVFYADKEYLIEKITGITTYKDGIYTKKINIDSRAFFFLDLSFRVTPIEDDSIEIPTNGIQALIYGLKTLILYDFELYYTDRSFANMVLDRYFTSRNLRREAIIDRAETLAKNYDFAKALFNGAAAFLREPETMIIKAKPVKPASIYHLINNLYELGLSLSFNGSDEFLVQKVE
jgi:hypothetical protein